MIEQLLIRVEELIYKDISDKFTYMYTYVIIEKQAWEYSHRFRKIEFYNRILKIHDENIIYAVLFRNKSLTLWQYRT